MSKALTIFAVIVTLGVATSVLGACTNTWEGAGRDVENIGEEMQHN